MCKGMRLTMMKRFIGIILILVFVLAGCGGSKMDVTVEEIPKYKNGIPYPIVLSVMDGDEAVTGLEIIATLEMARMDHGTIEVVFSDIGDGTYEGEVELPMAGEWIANIVLTLDGKTYDEILTFDVTEG